MLFRSKSNPFVHPSVRPSITRWQVQSVRPSVRPSVYHKVASLVRPSIRPSVRLSQGGKSSPSVRPSVRPSARAPVRTSSLFVCPSSPSARRSVQFIRPSSSSACPSVCPSARPPVRPFVQSIRPSSSSVLPVRPPVRQCVRPSVRQPARLSVRPSSPSVRPSATPLVDPFTSVCLSLHGCRSLAVLLSVRLIDQRDHRPSAMLSTSVNSSMSVRPADLIGSRPRPRIERSGCAFLVTNLLKIFCMSKFCKNIFVNYRPLCAFVFCVFTYA